MEYTLLVAFVGIVCIALMSNAGNSTFGIWATANSQLDQANASLNPSTQGSGGDTGTGTGTGSGSGNGGGGHDGDGHWWDGH